MCKKKKYLLIFLDSFLCVCLFVFLFFLRLKHMSTRAATLRWVQSIMRLGCERGSSRNWGTARLLLQGSLLCSPKPTQPQEVYPCLDFKLLACMENSFCNVKWLISSNTHRHTELHFMFMCTNRYRFRQTAMLMASPETFLAHTYSPSSLANNHILL